MLGVWHLANIPTTQKPNAAEKLKKLHQQLTNTYKYKHRHTKKQTELETESGRRLLELFNVAHAQGDQLIRIAFDVDFLQDQRRQRKVFIAGEEKPFNVK